MNKIEKLNEMRDYLVEIDKCKDIEVTDWEAKFIESILSMKSLFIEVTKKQQEICKQIIDKYREKL